MADRRPPPRKGQPPRRGPNPGGPARRPDPRPPQNENRERQASSKPAEEGPERLQKVLAHAGIGSRRACEELITQGRVTINGQVVRELGTRVDPNQARVDVDGQRIQGERLVYFAVHKPKGYVSSNNDPAGKPRVIDLLPEIPQRVYTVGRLDEQSMGLLLLTNDGELANKLAHPKFGVEKIYRVVVAGEPGREILDQLTQGVWLAEGKVRAKRVRIVGHKGLSTVLEMVLAEGKNREIRRMLARFGHKVMSLTRIAVGPIGLKGLTVGECRPLSAQELDLLRQVAAGMILPTPTYPDRRDRKPRPSRPQGRPSTSAQRPEGNRPPRPPFQREGGRAGDEGNEQSRPPGRPYRPAMQGRPDQGRPQSGVPRDRDNDRPQRPSGSGGASRPPQRSMEGQGRPPFRSDEGQGRPPRPMDRDRGPGNRPPQRPMEGQGRPPRPMDRDRGPGNRPPQRSMEGQGRPPRPMDRDRGPGNRPPQRPMEGQDRPPRPMDRDRGPGNRPPHHAQGTGSGNRPGQDRGPSGGRPPRPGGQGRPAGGPPPLRLKRSEPSGDGPPARKIIGLDVESGPPATARKRPPKRAPRASQGLKRPGKPPKPGRGD